MIEMDLYIIGAGGHGRVVADIASACGETSIKFIDREFPEKSTNGVWPVVAESALQLPKLSRLIVAVGDNARRQTMVQSFESNEFTYPVLVHPTAFVSPSAEIGAGTVVMPMAVINAGSKIGEHCIVNTSASVDHDGVMGDFSHVSPGARLAGGVSVGSRAWIGIGSVVREGCKIGSDAFVAAGACVVSDVKEGHRVYGTPAKTKS
jgi:sugar O-acyltransferase (sialic acid O-acetyltransferase NeuD family)